jgi:hypothetical protein
MKQILILLAAIFMYQSGQLHAQSLGYFMTDLKGEPLTNRYSAVTDGSPYLFDSWMKGKVITTDGKTYDNLSLKINLLDREIIFLNDQQQEIILKNPIREVVLTDLLKSTEYRFIRGITACGQKPDAFEEVLVPGRAQLLKTHVRTLTEVKPYGSATTEEKISASSRYYLLAEDGSCQTVKSPQELWTLLDSRKPGFAEKPSKTTAKKAEEELIRLAKSFNQ